MCLNWVKKKLNVDVGLSDSSLLLVFFQVGYYISFFPNRQEVRMVAKWIDLPMNEGSSRDE
jgi:hypothetical protein